MQSSLLELSDCHGENIDTEWREKIADLGSLHHFVTPTISTQDEKPKR